MRDKQLNLFGIDDNNSDMKKRYTIILPLDTIILLSIVVLLLLTLAFSLGVERGRKIALRNLEKKEKLLLERDSIIAKDTFTPESYNQQVKPIEPKLEEQTIEETTPILPEKKEAVKKEDKNSKDSVKAKEKKEQPVVTKNNEEKTAKKEIDKKQSKDKPVVEKNSTNTEGYIIQIASYNSEEAASIAAEVLKKKGYQVSLSKKGKFVVLYVGPFNNKNEADKSLKTLKDRYKDSFIRRL